MRILTILTLALLSIYSSQAQQKIGQKVKNQLFLLALQTECPQCVDRQGRLTQAAAELDSLNLRLSDFTLDGWDFTEYKHRTAIELKAFAKLKTFKIYHSQMLTIGSWPPNLEKLDIYNSDFYEPLPLLPAKLKTLICGDFNPKVKKSEFDKRRFFDYPLPPTLEKIEADRLGLEKMPSQLPASLKELWLGWNDISSFDSLPPNLEILNLDGNQIKQLPSRWPSSLRSLSLKSNPMFELPDDWGNCKLAGLDLSNPSRSPRAAVYELHLPQSLQELIISSGSLAVLKGELPAGLEKLDISDNNIVEIPALPPSLRYLNLSNNQLDSLLIGHTQLIELDATDNLLNFIDQWPNSLETINCSHNELSQLPAPLPMGLKLLRCTDNQLQTLPSLPASVEEARFFNNPIVSPPALPAGLEASSEHHYQKP